MSYVDRSGTNWLPWKSLQNANPRVVVASGVAGILGTAYVLFKVRASYAGALPKTMDKEWKEATKEKIRTGFEREAADPIPLNPITHHEVKKN